MSIYILIRNLAYLSLKSWLRLLIVLSFLNDLISNGGGYNSVRAEICLIKEAINHADYDRLVLLQGADYPIKSSEFILNFFEKNCDVEYCKCSRCTGSKERFLYSRCRHISFMNNRSFLKKAWNKFSSALDINIRSGKVPVDSTGSKADVFWGSAQWAFTGKAAKCILDFYDRNPRFNNWFKYAFAPDELYFASVIMNSPYATRTNNEEKNKGLALVCHRNLHYFEYPDGGIKVWGRSDYEKIISLPDLYIRKVTTEKSSKLLDMLDKTFK